MIIFTIILIIVNTYIITYYSLEERRIARLTLIVCYIIMFLGFKGYSKNKLIFGVLLTFLIVDILGFGFENALLSKIIYLTRMVGYCLLIASIYKKVKILKVKPHVFIIFSVVILLNFYLLYTLVESYTNSSNDLIEYILIIVYGLLVVVVATMAANYNFRYNSKRSTYFFYAFLAIVFSDLSWFAAYYLKFNTLFYVDVIFYSLSMYCLIYYALITSESDDVLLTED